MKSKTKFYVIGATENICKWKLMNFLKNYVLKKGKIFNVFWKGNKMNGGNKDALQSGRDRYTAKNYITT